MSMTESYITILDSSLDKKLAILDRMIELNAQQKELLNMEKLDEEAFHGLTEQKAELIDKLDSLDDGFQMVYDKVKAELDNNRVQYGDEIKSLKDKIAMIMEKSSHILAEEQRNKERAKQQFAARRREITSVRKNSQYAANYYKTMNKLSGEPVFMDKKK